MSVLGWFGFRVWGLQGELFSHVHFSLIASLDSGSWGLGFSVSINPKPKGLNRLGLKAWDFKPYGARGRRLAGRLGCFKLAFA